MNRDDNKRLVQADEISTLARGHYDAKEVSWSEGDSRSEEDSWSEEEVDLTLKWIVAKGLKSIYEKDIN